MVGGIRKKKGRDQADKNVMSDAELTVIAPPETLQCARRIVEEWEKPRGQEVVLKVSGRVEVYRGEEQTETEALSPCKPIDEL